MAVVGTLRHHVCEVDSLPKHVACLEEQGQVKTSSQDRPASPPPHPICASGIEDEVVTGDHLSGTSFSEQGGWGKGGMTVWTDRLQGAAMR